MKCEFPVILKPAYKESINDFTRAKAWLAKDLDELIKLYDLAARLVDPSLILVREMIDGGGENQFSYAGLHDEGRPIASLVARRTRQYPVDFGRSSCFVETIDSAEIEKPAKLLLKAIHYTGIAELEFKYDLRDKHYKLLDVNPRVWTWASLGTPAGVDFPYLLWRFIHSEKLPQIHARPGVKWAHAIPDLRAGVTEMRRGRLTPASYLRSYGSALEFAVMATDDPFPALLELSLLLASKLTPKRSI